MPSTIAETVLFEVNVQVFPTASQQWVCVGKETGIISMGASKTEAVRRNSVLHEALVKRLKEKGLPALTRFMTACGIRAQFDNPNGTVRLFPSQQVTTDGSGEHMQLSASVA